MFTKASLACIVKKRHRGMITKGTKSTNVFFFVSFMALQEKIYSLKGNKSTKRLSLWALWLCGRIFIPTNVIRAQMFFSL